MATDSTRSETTPPSPEPTTGPPGVPIPLQHCPTHAGLVIPWVSARTGTRILFGVVDRQRLATALRQRRCGVCGQPLRDRLVLMMRLTDLSRRRSNEPPLHPWCAAYSATACLMLAGQMRHYRASASPLPQSVLPAPDSAARQGAAAQPWFAVWLTAYTLISDGENLAVAYDPD